MDFLVTPDLPIKINGKSYNLSGSFNSLKRIQHATGKDILVTLEKFLELDFVECAKIMQIAIDEAGDKVDIETLEEWIVDVVGISPIRSILQGWLFVCTRPKIEREEAKKTVGKILEGLGLAPLIENFIGNNTSK
jgi:hypothetical protein